VVVSALRRFWSWAAAGALAIGLALAATVLTPLGFAMWHYNASFVAALVAAVAAWPWLRARRVATLTMAFTGIVATVTGFVMLYSKDLPYKEWVTWWHSFTSFALALAFLVHWLNNRQRLWEFTQRLATSDRAPGAALAGAWLAVGLGAGWTWLTDVRVRFTSENYLYLAGWAVLGAVALAYGTWLLYRLPAMRARLAVTRHRNLARAAVDVSLFLAHWGAIVTGLALVWFAAPLRAGPLKYVSKWWHTATSVAFLALLVLHIGFNARLLAAHARRVDAELAPGR
jgi:hypothetical protein